jgi:hypothetical protein
MKGEFAIVLELATSKKHRKRYVCAVIVQVALPRHNAGRVAPRWRDPPLSIEGMA